MKVKHIAGSRRNVTYRYAGGPLSKDMYRTLRALGVNNIEAVRDSKRQRKVI